MIWNQDGSFFYYSLCTPWPPPACGTFEGKHSGRLRERYLRQLLYAIEFMACRVAGDTVDSEFQSEHYNRGRQLCVMECTGIKVSPSFGRKFFACQNEVVLIAKKSADYSLEIQDTPDGRLNIIPHSG